MKKTLLFFCIFTFHQTSFAQMTDEEAANSDCMRTVSLSNPPTITPEREECYKEYYKNTTKETIKKVIVVKSECISSDVGYPIYLRTEPNYDAPIIYRFPIGTILWRKHGLSERLVGITDVGCFDPIVYNGKIYYAIDKKLDIYCGNKNAIGGEPKLTNNNKTNLNSLSITYPTVTVNGGTFTMGANPNEEKVSFSECQHSVAVSTFNMGIYEVTQSIWFKIMGGNPSENKNCDECPVTNVSYQEITQFIAKLNLMTGKVYRLPTVQEWEFAARGGKFSKKYIYSGSNDYQDIAWYGNNANFSTHKVGTKKPNELGIFDMTGNVEEWTSTPYTSYPCDREYGDYGDKTFQEVRGGSIINYFSYELRISRKMEQLSKAKQYFRGFRLVLVK